MIKRLIFDVDGTLINGVSFVPIIESTLKKMNMYSQENVSLFLEAISSYETLYNNYNKEDYLIHIANYLHIKFDEKFLDIFFDELRYCVPSEYTKLKRSIINLAKEYEMVLLTNFFKESQMNRLTTMGIADLFLDCFGEELIKPNDEIYIKACGNNLPYECVMIGDDYNLDIIKAQIMGLNTIWVNHSNIKNEDRIITVKDVDEITLELIDKINKSNKKISLRKYPNINY